MGGGPTRFLISLGQVAQAPLPSSEFRMNIPIYPRIVPDKQFFPGKEMSPAPSLGIFAVLLFLSELTSELGEF